MKKKRLLIVDDSIFMRTILSDKLGKYDDIEVIANAKNGEEAVSKNLELKPDAILLDMEMPVMNGIDALRKIMQTRPTCVVVFSTLTGKGAKITLDALELGACDFSKKPSSRAYEISSNLFDELHQKIISSKLSKTIRRPVMIRKPITSKISSNKKPAKTVKNIIAIGTSTGGPKALTEVLPYLPSNLNAAVVIVQHMPEAFTKPLAERLNKICKLKTQEAKDLERLENANIYIAKGGKHLILEEDNGNIVLRLGDGDKNQGHKPSANEMFKSLRKIKNVKKIGVLMTGMGKDGAEEMLNLKKEGGYTIAQDEETSVVFGMPKAAIEIKAVKSILPLGQIADEIAKLVEV